MIVVNQGQLIQLDNFAIFVITLWFLLECMSNAVVCLLVRVVLIAQSRLQSPPAAAATTSDHHAVVDVGELSLLLRIMCQICILPPFLCLNSRFVCDGNWQGSNHYLIGSQSFLMVGNLINEGKMVILSEFVCACMDRATL